MASKPMTDADRSPCSRLWAGRARVPKSAGIFSRGFAHYCGLDRSYMGGVERGERNMTLANIERIIAALHMKPSEFSWL
jgi:transcriptional regulator with XRE-family HTH domain